MLNLIRLVISFGININQDLLVKSEAAGLDWLDTLKIMKGFD